LLEKVLTFLAFSDIVAYQRSVTFERIVAGSLTRIKLLLGARRAGNVLLPGSWCALICR
jgi:hypothetical protein